jgi:adenine-specific DNA methylase
MTNKLTENYKPRIEYNAEFPLDDLKNRPFVEQLARFLATRSKHSAKSYADKNKGVKNSGKGGKEYTVTIKDFIEAIIKSNGKSPDGTIIHFAPLGIFNMPTQAIAAGLLTSEQQSRFPSIDRIDSSKGYIPGNIQLTTKRYNLGKSSNDVVVTPIIKENVTLKWKGIEVEMEVTSSFLANTLKELVN